MRISTLWAIAFGEMDLSPITVAGLIGIAVFLFLAVGISTLSLFRGVSESDESIQKKD